MSMRGKVPVQGLSMHAQFLRHPLGIAFANRQQRKDEFPYFLGHARVRLRQLRIEEISRMSSEQRVIRRDRRIQIG